MYNNRAPARQQGNDGAGRWNGRRDALQSGAGSPAHSHHQTTISAPLGSNIRRRGRKTVAEL